MDEQLLNAIDQADRARQIAYGLRGLIVELETSGARPSTSEIAALAELAQSIGDHCEQASVSIRNADKRLA